MAVRFILMMALIMIGSADPIPDPDQDVHIDVKQIVNAQCGGGCCNNDCCTFDGKKYGSGDNIVAGCAKLCCKHDGEWEYKGIIEYCGNCTAGGEPSVYPFDYPWTPAYSTWVDGQYVLTQHGLGRFTPPAYADYGVNGFFVGFEAYVKGAIYYENFGTDWISVDCIYSGDPWAPCSSLNARMGNPNRPVTSFPSRKGSIWVFKRMSCIIIVGVKLNVVMCPKVPGAPQPNDPYVYIYAPQSLRSWSSALYGLCKRYLHEPTINYMASNGTIYTTYTGPFMESWKV